MDDDGFSRDAESPPTRAELEVMFPEWFRTPAPAPDDAGPRWAVPGVVDDDERPGAGGLSAGSTAVLAETAQAVRALRLAQARCYRALYALQNSDAPSESGYRHLSRLLEDHVRLSPDEARRLARHAVALTAVVSPSGATVPSELPTTATLVEEGVIGDGHVDVIRRTMTTLDAVVPALAEEVLATGEAQLADLATTHSPAQLKRAAQSILARLDPDGTAPEDDPPPENELHWSRRKDGTVRGRFAYRDPAAAEFLLTALDSATPLPESTGLAGPDGRGPVGEHGERGESPDAHAHRTLPERRAQALLDLAGEVYTRGGLDTTDRDSAPDDGAGGDDATVRGLFAPDTDDGEEPASPTERNRAASEGGERIALSLTVDFETLRRRLDEQPTREPDGPDLALLGENTYVRPETARRLACDAELIPAVMGSGGQPLDVGRKHRIVPPHIRHALYLRDHHCAHPGCRRRARKCHAHHVLHWIDGGETCLLNCVLLCSYHHGLQHRSGWEIVMIDGMPWFRPPRWLDPSQRLRHNRPWQRDAAVA
ncbi:HNH endonuclease signature motif containing protein [Actinomycetospora sp.]|uniref:HNH endonuclease signature motif containing protein n=1 Tax=Actinomycetospora sp. TaxID=1872135 RepID=UPI002F40F498